MKRIFPSFFYNPVTLVGAAIAGVSFGLVLFLMVLETVTDNPKPYMGIIAFVLLPSILLIGLFILVFGIFRERRRESAGKPEVHLPQIDLNNPRHRTAFIFFSLGTFITDAITALTLILTLTTGINTAR